MTTRHWAPGLTRVPLWVYADEQLFDEEMTRIFEGPSWNYVALAAEVAEPGAVKATTIGRRPVIVTRDKSGAIHVLENRCAHRGLKLCHRPFDSQSTLECPYHRWRYDLGGRVLGIPMRRGIDGKGGLPADTDTSTLGLRALRVHERHGVVFASFDDAVEPFEQYLGEAMLAYFDRVFDGRRLTVLGDMHQRIPANWKLMFENIKDPYHASTLHVFLTSFGLFRADNPSATQMDETGRHSVLVNARRPPEERTSDLDLAARNLELEGPMLLDVVKEFAGTPTLVMQTIWPGLIVQQQSNTLAVRQIEPLDAGSFDLHWTFFGYETDDDAMTSRRLMQANLMGPSGYVSLDDGEVLDLVQRGAAGYPDGEAYVEMGTGTDDADHAVTEAGVRAFYRYYRSVMGI